MGVDRKAGDRYRPVFAMDAGEILDSLTKTGYVVRAHEGRKIGCTPEPPESYKYALADHEALIWELIVARASDPCCKGRIFGIMVLRGAGGNLTVEIARDKPRFRGSGANPPSEGTK